MARDEDPRTADMIERLEARAKDVLRLLPSQPSSDQAVRRPFVLEFAGTPKAGKTTTVDRLELLLRRNDYRVRVLKESAGASPLKSKNDPRFNIWTAVTMLGQVLEALDRDDHIVIIDRGVFDALCWMEWFKSAGRIALEEHRDIERFLCLPRLRRLVDLVFVLTVDPATALEREFAGQLTRRQGQIMNLTTLRDLNQAIGKVKLRHRNDFSLVELDTTKGVAMDMLDKLARDTLDGLEAFRDSVMVVPRHKLEELRISGFVSDHSRVQQFLALVHGASSFMGRKEAESSQEHVQIIPIAYFEHSGRFLLLRRKERNPEHRLHDKYAIWAGGHVRKEDFSGGDDPIPVCLVREIEEELFISQLPSPSLVGLVADSSNDRSRMHIGVVHSVKLLDASVAEPMHEHEFKEADGAGFRARLVDPDELGMHYRLMERWSQLIVADHLRLVTGI